MRFGLIALAAAERGCGRLPQHCRLPSRSSLAQSRVAEQLAADAHPDAIGRGIAEQIALCVHAPR